MDPDYEQRLLRQINGPKTPTKLKGSPIVSVQKVAGVMFKSFLVTIFSFVKMMF